MQEGCFEDIQQAAAGVSDHECSRGPPWQARSAAAAQEARKNTVSDRQKIPLFVELCAGTAALSLRLHSKSGKPPVSRQGSKQGYADAILRVLGLDAGQGAEEYFWSDPDEGVRMLLYTYMDHIFAEQVSEKIRSWAHKDPAEHWSAEPPCKTEGDVLRAAWCLGQRNRKLH